ncbi:hypothetical protein [Neopusillimonas maritima]|uniref:Uncharacterized protein n=1 Tax=Neopusillimonas maritima TaxID=2026239 RepID=A0ABX9MX09_9BURK|nr:hypothetical protein [Neopusillimonas maritima]RII83472.1 hypothetical protein CJO09_07725 [Neopusillimonas maritima]
MTTPPIRAHLNTQYRQADKIMLPVLWLLFIMALALTPWYATYMPALLVGLPAAAIPSLFIFLRPGARITRSLQSAELRAMVDGLAGNEGQINLAPAKQAPRSAAALALHNALSWA